MERMARVKTGPEAIRLFGVAPSPDWLAFAEQFPSGWRAGDDDALVAWVATKTKDASEVEPLADVTELFGLTRLTDLRTSSWPEPLWRHAYPVGRAANGDELVQVGAGRLRGKILRVDHETVDAPAEWAKTTDTLVDLLLEEAADIVADSMSELCARVCGARQAHPCAPGTLELPCGMQSIDVDGDRILLGPSYRGGSVALVHGGRLEPLPVTRSHIQRVLLRQSRILLLGHEALELSVDGGASFRKLDVGRASDAIVLADGTLWVARDHGLGWSVDDGRRFEWHKSPARARTAGFVPTTHGLTVIAYDQLLFVSATEIRATRPRRSSRVMAVTETPERTLLAVVDAVGVLRSTDGGQKWRKSKESPPGGTTRSRSKTARSS